MLLRSALLAAFAVLALSGCDPAPSPDTDPYLQPVAPVASGGNAFQVQVTLSEAAAGALDANDASIIVSADYFGYPSVAAQQRQLPGTDEPRLRLARHQLELDGAGMAEFPEITLDPELLQMVEEGRPQLRLDVYSAQAGAAGAGEAIDDMGDNLLDCGTFQDTLAAAVRTGIELDCKLIAE